ncbi:zinc finger protein 480-like [Anopheles cruzii]|uniref:zinc finger protein 480-like n=1 Tax=Anopheles cruzii TaxID=68878 RepID=UPI0022EC47C8|nr:zinc finger protein 480-like [Anopheles cruzii]
MGRKCCVPRCCSNYDAIIKRGHAGISTFKFPRDPTLRERWIKAVPKTNWIPSKEACICINHFHPEDILKYDKPAKLKQNAVPTLFGDNLMNVQSKLAPKSSGGTTRTTKSSQIECQTISSAEHILEDCIINFENFKDHVNEKLQHCKWILLLSRDVVHLFTVIVRDDHLPIQVGNSLQVYRDLKIRLFLCDEEQRAEQLRWILGLDDRLLRWSQLETIMNKYDDISEQAAGKLHPYSPNQTEESLEEDQLDLGSHEEHLEDPIDGEEAKHHLQSFDNEKTMTSTTIELEIEEQDIEQNLHTVEVDDHFLDIDGRECSETELEDHTQQQAFELKHFAPYKSTYSIMRELRNTKNKCFVCDVEHETLEDRDQHMPTHLSMLPYQCQLCVRGKVIIKTLASLNKHFLMHRKPLKCRFCDVRFNSYGSRSLHEDIKHGGAVNITCDVCQRDFSSKRSYQYHRKIHDDPEALRCKLCGRILSSAYEVKAHMRTHTGEKPNQCAFCAASFNRRSNLIEHIRRYHSLERPFECDVCGERFRLNAGLKRHQQSHEPNVSATGKRSNRVSRAPRLFHCKECDLQFDSAVRYHSHKRQHDRRYQCSYCGIRICQLRDFEDHQNTHTGARPYVCKTCGKSFKTASTYYGHLMVHRADKKHVCSVCAKGFIRQRHLQIHMRTHTGEKPYSCDTCGQKYADKKSFSRHTLTHQPTVGDMLRAKEMLSKPTTGTHTSLALAASSGTNVAVNQETHRHNAFTYPQSSGGGILVMPSVAQSALENATVFDVLSDGSFLTDLPQTITTNGEDGTIVIPAATQNIILVEK